METGSTKEPQLEIIKYLYQFKDDNKFYDLDNYLLNIKSPEEKCKLVYTLREKALIATDREIYKKQKEHYTLPDNEIKARILPKGILAVEALSKSE